MSKAQELADELTKYGAAFDDGPGMFGEAARELRRLDRVNAELEKDAARYRRLRIADPDAEVAPMRHECNDWGKWYWLPVLGKSLDKELDAALSSSGGNES